MDTPATYTALAASLFHQIPNEKNRHCPKIGMNDELASRLTSLSLSELRALTLKAERFLTIRIDKPVLEQILLEVANDDDNSELQDQFLYHYATNTMMREFFGMHTTEFCARRKLLGLAGKGQHRPQYCDEETEIRIWKQFQRFGHLDIRQRYLKVAEITGQPLNIVWPAIQRHKVSS